MGRLAYAALLLAALLAGVAYEACVEAGRVPTLPSRSAPEPPRIYHRPEPAVPDDRDWYRAPARGCADRGDCPDEGLIFDLQVWMARRVGERLGRDLPPGVQSPGRPER